VNIEADALWHCGAGFLFGPAPSRASDPLPERGEF
jgi:hypothetical protein